MFYQNMHRELGDYLEKRLGYRPEVELAEETRAQRVYTDKSVDIDKVRGAVDRAVVRPAEDEAAANRRGGKGGSRRFAQRSRIA